MAHDTKVQVGISSSSEVLKQSIFRRRVRMNDLNCIHEIANSIELCPNNFKIILLIYDLSLKILKSEYNIPVGANPEDWGLRPLSPDYEMGVLEVVGSP